MKFAYTDYLNCSRLSYFFNFPSKAKFLVGFDYKVQKVDFFVWYFIDFGTDAKWFWSEHFGIDCYFLSKVTHM